MKNKSIFRILGLFAFVALLFTASKYSGGSSEFLEDSAQIEATIGKPTASVIGMDHVIIDTITQKKKHSAGLASKTKTKINQDQKTVVILHKGYSNVADTRECIADYMLSQVGVREKTNHNDGKAIFGYFKNIGWKNPEKLKSIDRFYCGAFMGTAWLNCMETVPFVKSKTELAQVIKWQTGPGVSKEDADRGDAVTLKGYSHVQGVYERHPNPTFAFYTTVTANSSPEANDPDRRGGVFKKTALWRDVKKVISVEKTLDLV